MDNQLARSIEEARAAVEKSRQEERSKKRIMRHMTKPAHYFLPALLTPEQRAYMKHFGSRSAKKRKRVAA